MDPWTHEVDNCLETRKTAYESMYTLVRLPSLKRLLVLMIRSIHSSTSTSSLDVSFLGSLRMKSKSSRTRCFRLCQVTPAAVAQRLDEVTLQLEKTMEGVTVTKDTVKRYLG